MHLKPLMSLMVNFKAMPYSSARSFTTALVALLALIIPCIPSYAVENTLWQKVVADNLVTLQTHYGPVTIALEPDLGPQHVARFRNLIKEGFYGDRYFYRVVDGFVAQGGSNETHEVTPKTSLLKAEFTVPLKEAAMVVEHNDPFAPATGFYHGFPVGIDKSRREMWALHCPGTVAFARDNEKDTGSTEFYIVIGQAPRHLDRNMSVVGRVVAGMPALQNLPRGDNDKSGFIESPPAESKIVSTYIGAAKDVKTSDTQNAAPFYLQLPTHSEYKKRIELGKNLESPFFHDKVYAPRPIDVCYYTTKATQTPW